MWRPTFCATLLLLSVPALSQPTEDPAEPEWPEWSQPGWDAATVYAVIAKNEWCPGGAVMLDLWTSRYVLVPRNQRPGCSSPDGSRRVQDGILPDGDLARLRAAYRLAAAAGLEMHPKNDVITVTNGGPELLVVTGPNFDMVTPEASHDWSLEARALHDLLFEIFGTAQTATPFRDLAGRRTVAPTE